MLNLVVTAARIRARTEPRRVGFSQARFLVPLTGLNVHTGGLMRGPCGLLATVRATNLMLQLHSHTLACFYDC